VVVRRVKILNDAVDSSKIAADVVVAADIAAGAIGQSELASTAVTGAKIASTTIDNTHIKRVIHQSGLTYASADNAGTVIEFPTNFTTTPNVVVTVYGSGTAAMPTLRVDSVSTASFKLYTNTSGSYYWYASVQPTA